MFALEHKIRVFVFQVLERDIQYLLLRHKPRTEWPLGPVVGAVSPGEQIRDAILREVRLETGIERPILIRELTQPQKELFGDMGLIEWPYGYQAGGPTSPVQNLVPGPMVGEVAWMGFEEAFQRLESALDRDALVRLQLSLQ